MPGRPILTAVCVIVSLGFFVMLARQGGESQRDLEQKVAAAVVASGYHNVQASCLRFYNRGFWDAQKQKAALCPDANYFAIWVVTATGSDSRPTSGHACSAQIVKGSEIEIRITHSLEPRLPK